MKCIKLTQFFHCGLGDGLRVSFYVMRGLWPTRGSITKDLDKSDDLITTLVVILP